jgi:beta-galactosidase
MFSIHSRRRQYFSRQIINKEFASRWYPGAGLYRNVSLIIKKQRKYRPMGTVYNHTFISSAVAKVNVKTKVSGENTRLVTTILMPKGIN